ncbi:MAG: glutamate synthase-related protein [Proteobacteria bacterium]|nr:glutamate synthase-related protein [Pseudomonadota bacterium]
MPKKYHIEILPAPPRFTPIGKSGIVDWGESCLKCHNCVKKLCVYEVYRKRSFDGSQMTDSLDSLCKNCFRCVQECTKGILAKSANPEYRSLGDSYYTPDIISSNWYQAETGKIPVSGAGYGGLFTGPGFDEMWTDMSEIVRPTRDGIHGREYISTSVDLGRKPSFLEFSQPQEVSTPLPPIVEIPVPFIFNLLPLGDVSQNLYLSLAKAAHELSTFLTIEHQIVDSSFSPYLNAIIPYFNDEITDGNNADLIKKVQMVQIAYHENVINTFQKIKNINPKVIVSIQVLLNRKAVEIVDTLTDQGAEMIHLCADIHGKELAEENPRFIKDALRDIHLSLVEKGKRDCITLIASGGIAMAEHVAKVIICGADAVVLDIPLLLALECRLCLRCQHGLSCPVNIAQVTPEWSGKRIKNLVGAWRNQLLEVLGAMGLREIRRLRGETGRAIFFNDIEQETFGKMFGERTA